jgi:uncharacterized membrane protein
MTPTVTYVALLVVQALHLLHHRLAKRHISLVEALSAGVLCAPPMLLPGIPGWLFMSVHGALIVTQIAGSIWIRKLSPSWRS